MSAKLVGKELGRVGKLLVEQRLIELGWHPIRLDVAQLAANADLLAVNKKSRVSLQVKTTTESNNFYFGHTTAYGRDPKRLFNSKDSPLEADVIVGLNYAAEKFVVLPVAFAEKLCRAHFCYWSKVPKKPRKDGSEPERRRPFPIYLRFDTDTLAPYNPHRPHHEKMKRNISRFEDRWNLLSEPIDRLHDEAAWSLQ